MSAFYLSLQSTAGRMLAGKGRAMVLRKRTPPGAYNPATGAATVTAVDHPAIGAVFDFPALLIDGTRIQAGDKKVLLAADTLGAEPTTSDQLVIGGNVHNIVSVQAIGPDGTVVVWKVQVRR